MTEILYFFREILFCLQPKTAQAHLFICVNCMITSLILGSSGQLGNQIFQYTVLLGIRALHGYEIGLVSNNKKGNFIDAKTNSKQHYELSLDKCFQIPEPFLPSRKIKIRHKVKELFYHFDPSILQVQDQTGLWGFFESEKYFEHCKDEVRRSLTFKPEIVERAVARMKPYRDRGKKLVSIHVRRGQDRPGFQLHHPFTTLEFYRAAMASFDKDSHEFLVFTDDFEWCYQSFPDAHIVQWDRGYVRPDFVDLCMMSLCDHHIIANSTFSWWGAWLNASDTKRVIAPQLWFGPAKLEANGMPLNIADNIPAGWERM